MPVATSLDLGKFNEFAKPLVEAGRYSSANEVLAAAMDALTREASEEHKIARLKAVIEAGFSSGVVKGDLFASV